MQPNRNQDEKSTSFKRNYENYFQYDFILSKNTILFLFVWYLSFNHTGSKKMTNDGAASCIPKKIISLNYCTLQDSRGSFGVEISTCVENFEFEFLNDDIGSWNTS